jgi:hypothetical protein
VPFRVTDVFRYTRALTLVGSDEMVPKNNPQVDNHGGWQKSRGCIGSATRGTHECELASRVILGPEFQGYPNSKFDYYFAGFSHDISTNVRTSTEKHETRRKSQVLCVCTEGSGVHRDVGFRPVHRDTG